MAISDEAKDYNKLCSAARGRALIALSKRHPEEFARLRDEFRERMGLPPPIGRKNRPAQRATSVRTEASTRVE